MVITLVIMRHYPCKWRRVCGVQWNPLPLLCFVGGLIDDLRINSVYRLFIQYFEGSDEDN